MNAACLPFTFVAIVRNIAENIKMTKNSVTIVACPKAELHYYDLPLKHGSVSGSVIISF